MEKYPTWYASMAQRHSAFIKAVEDLGKVVRQEGPLDDKTAQLIQLAAAATLRSEGAVHSHAKRAIDEGAQPDEVRHALMLLTSTIGFPTVAAALSWIEEIIGDK
jgi:alkylhydroperoxidase/carboxymuconolactone decarboxylase family protein YurZ